MRNALGDVVPEARLTSAVGDRYDRWVAALDASRANWLEVLNTLDDVVTIHDLDFNIVAANDVARQVLQLPNRDSTYPTKCYLYYHGLDSPPHQCAGCLVMQTCKPAVLELFEPHLDRHLEVRALPRFDEDGKLAGVVHVARDVSRRKLAEQELATYRGRLEELLERRVRDLRTANEELAAANAQLRDEQAKLVQAEKLSSIGLLASGVAHEVNNPLAGVKACVQALRNETIADSRRDEYWNTIQEGLTRIEQTVHSLLDFARQGPPARMRLRLFDVAVACLRLIAPALRHKNITIDNALQDARAMVSADQGQLMQAVLNVLLNAVQASPAGSIIRLTARFNVHRVGLCIADEGPGIPAAIRARVLDPFFTTKPAGEGTGLGLPVALGALRANGGDISIADGPGGGAEITLWLPEQ